MYFAHTALAAACFVVLVKGEDEKQQPQQYVTTQASKEQITTTTTVTQNEDDGDESDTSLIDNHTFVALVDIVFTDKSKRTCTGSIIHENVVITAAHCFKTVSRAKPELTASFIVIGTKAMFDAGYEQYLPIERVVTHPHYKGWTADLSLVYTFAGMTSDKPGTIIPLAGEKTSTHVDANVTILSWGRIIAADLTSEEQTTTTTARYDFHEFHDDDEDSCSSDEHALNHKGLKKKVTAPLQINTEIKVGLRAGGAKPSVYKEESQLLLHKHQKNRELDKKNEQRKKMIEPNIREDIESLKIEYDEQTSTKIISRYLSDNEKSKEKEKMSGAEKAVIRRYHIENRNETTTTMATRNFSDIKHDVFLEDDDATKIKWLPVIDAETIEDKRSLEQLKNDQIAAQQPYPAKTFSFDSYYKNWRRSMGTQQNQLTVENFGFVNLQACKSLIEKSMPSKYHISKNNDVICYASETRYINNDDAGAPAIRRGQLVAVTVGGAECDGDHVAIGMKMSCYCSWIADNLPTNNRDDLNCCKNCCDVKHKEEVPNDKKYRFKNKYFE